MQLPHVSEVANNYKTIITFVEYFNYWMTIVCSCQSYGKSSLYRSTVLDMIANELGESGVDPTRYV